ncbi:amidohydrolase family protein [Mucilaginibacter xinganensis]|uniref:Uncharacterized protein n=1 Tax=Mucilaginibacter xinganensis TaxID=1234841 RepID=A0A223NZ89_9SPHI|nr:amidohydrolase family protein [Mucilaginibacter xinganensis]ASU35183.1 hypothetical protein MuYL_3298 [Mucilaginibacter xinganensis]
MILRNVNMVGSNKPVNIRIEHGKIAEITIDSDRMPHEQNQFSFDKAIVFPGLVNSHDHLDFNLFPQLGNKSYNNYTEWGKHLHAEYHNEIAAVLQIPALLRSEWGMYKNLLCGITTVVNHGERSGLKNPLINIFENSHCLHSVQFEKNWRRKLNNPVKKSIPVNIHIGEGIDAISSEEIDLLIKFNLFRRKLVGVHAVAMSAKQAEKFEALVWCPESNYFLLNKTADINELKKHTRILFGTDSTLTGSWNIWEHLSLARKTGLLSDEELYHSVNKTAASTWQLNSGGIIEGLAADLVIAKQQENQTGLNNFFSTTPTDLLMVIHNGGIRLFDKLILPQLPETDLKGFSQIYLDGACKYVKGNLPALINNIRDYCPDANFPVTAKELVQI